MVSSLHHDPRLGPPASLVVAISLAAGHSASETGIGLVQPERGARIFPGFSPLLLGLCLRRMAPPIRAAPFGGPPMRCESHAVYQDATGWRPARRYLATWLGICGARRPAAHGHGLQESASWSGRWCCFARSTSRARSDQAIWTTPSNARSRSTRRAPVERALGNPRSGYALATRARSLAEAQAVYSAMDDAFVAPDGTVLLTVADLVRAMSRR